MFSGSVCLYSYKPLEFLPVELKCSQKELLVLLNLRRVMRLFEFHYFTGRKNIQEETIQDIFSPHFPEVDIPTNSPQYTAQPEHSPVSVLNLKNSRLYTLKKTEQMTAGVEIGGLVCPLLWIDKTTMEMFSHKAEFHFCWNHALHINLRPPFKQ